MSAEFNLALYLPLIFLVWIPILAYCWALHINSYWKRKNIPYIPAIPFIGNVSRAIRFKTSAAEQFQDLYLDKDTRNKPFVGIHIFHKPALLIRDLELIKRILVKDFGSFSNRHTNSSSYDRLGSDSLFFIRNKQWKQLRARLTPTFTSGKMKQMYGLLNQVGEQLNKHMLSSTESKSTVTEIKDLCARYTTDVIGSTIFGVHANSINDPNSEFRENGKKVFLFNWYRAIEFTSFWFLPEIASFFKFQVFSQEASKFLRNAVNYVIDDREKNGITRNDLIDTLVTLKKEDQDKKRSDVNTDDIVFQGDTIIAQAAMFFSAGFETSSSLITFALFELSWQPEIQKKLRQEIKDVLTKSKGELLYDDVYAMEYLNMVVSETLRMYPPLPFLDRMCTLNSKETGYSLEPFSQYQMPNGMPVIIPIFAIQRDPKYFPNPTHFDPERFSAKNKANVLPYTYLPFGAGPHNCIGDRFGLMQAKVGLIQFFRNHYAKPLETTPRKICLESKALLIQSESGINLNIIREPLFE